MTKTYEAVNAAVPFCREAYADGLAGENRGAWERFAEQSVEALREITGKEPSPASIKFVRMVCDECRAAWETGWKKGGHHAKG